jgi:hypothetical protein
MRPISSIISPVPGGIRLRIIAQDTVIPGVNRPLSVLVAGPCVTVQNEVLIFMGRLAAALLTLGLTLGALIAAQVTYGLRPLGMVRGRSYAGEARARPC